MSSSVVYTSSSPLKSPQIKNLLKIKYLRDDIKGGNSIKETKHYADLANEEFDKEVTLKTDPKYASSILTLSNAVIKYAKDEDIDVLNYKFADEYLKVKPKTIFKGFKDWPTDGSLAQTAIMKLCESDLLNDKKHIPIRDLLNKFYTGEALELKKKRADKAKETRENKKSESDEVKKQKYEKQIEKAQKNLEKLETGETSKPKAKAKASTSKITKEESEDEESEAESEEASASESDE